MSSNEWNYRRMIQSTKWARLRRAVLGERPLCECCMQAGLMVPATEVHHIVPVETQHSVPDMERMMYNVSNLEPLCHDCHVRRHKELRSKSKDVIKERERVKLERFREKFC